MALGLLSAFCLLHLNYCCSSCTIGHNGTLLLQGGSLWEKENEGRLKSTEVVDFADHGQENNICSILGDGNSSCGDENDGV